MENNGQKLIEMVCTGNQGRSPVAELIAQNYLRKVGADRDYRSISSGTAVDDIKADRMAMGFMLTTIETAKSRSDLGIYTPLELDAINDAVKEGNNAAITHYYNKAANVFIQEERQNRAEVLPLLGIEGKTKHIQEQTIPRYDTLAVLSMAKSNNEAVKKIYAGSGYSPVIDTLSSVATGVPGAEILNAFGKTKDVYIRTVEQIKYEVPKALEKLLI
jgi:protein-tyrosine-phosphatase